MLERRERLKSPRNSRPNASPENDQIKRHFSNDKCNYFRYAPVIFEWDESKRERNIAKHAIDFIDCEDVFAGPTVSVPDDRFDYGEARFVTFGLLGGSVVAVAHTETVEIIRVISMRKATKREQALYFQTLQN
jgi:uncharacterized protein